MGVASTMRFAWLGVCLSLLLCRVCATADSLPDSYGVNLVFPRNDTYDATGSFPIVFAVRNASALAIDAGTITYELYPFWQNMTCENRRWGGGELYLQSYNSSNLLDTYFASNFITNLGSFDGPMFLVWWVTTECGVRYWPNIPGGSVVFSLKNGTKPPDLVTATAPGACTQPDGFVFNDTALDQAYHGNTPPAGFSCQTAPECQAFVTPQPAQSTATPCAVQVDAAQAASISASASAWGCSYPDSSGPPKCTDGATFNACNNPGDGGLPECAATTKANATSVTKASSAHTFRARSSMVVLWSEMAVGFVSLVALFLM